MRRVTSIPHYILFALIFCCTPSILFSQGRQQVSSALEQFSGMWYCPSANRYLEIFIDQQDSSLVTINEWNNIPNRKVAMNVDAYKVFYQNGKLIAPADHIEHHASYCELSIEKNMLLYRCNGANNVTEQQLLHDQFLSTIIFIRKPKNKSRSGQNKQ